jgi:uncharacterized protein (TIGR00730 family)
MMNKTYPKQPLTLKELNDQIEDRIEKITDEFTKGFDFIKNCTNSVTFFGSARTKEDEPDYQKCQEVARRVAEELKYCVVTGGGPGIMEAANRGAYEAGGRSVGFTINLPMEQVTNKYLTDHLGFYYFFSRKVCLSFSAEAFVYFPGGFGTYDELFELTTLVQTKKIEKVPIILVGVEYWTKFLNYIKENLLEEKKIDEEDLDLFVVTDDVDEVIDIIKKAPKRLA